MSAKIDPVEVARSVWNEAIASPGSWKVISGREALALSMVVIAASERVKSGHSRYCPIWADGAHEDQDRGATCPCGHDALVAALKGE
jgi:ferredoxin-thioredoxin reductase catalytic subunit